ncbi:hypothetical protein AB0M46_40545 [Dactylosporangium sp. NPDC051485]|uniref:hypothetical protein n=1 Tax=Dactylosporangium sp. NPDC051485 TaxID=3154846 RepID=UPI0034208ABC
MPGELENLEQVVVHRIVTETYNIRCRLSHNETWISLALFAVFGSTIMAGVLGFAAFMICATFGTPLAGAVCATITMAVTGMVGALIGIAGTGMYGNICKSLNGVTLRSTVIRMYHWITGQTVAAVYGYPLMRSCN